METSYYGVTDSGLRDARANMRPWGLEFEIERCAELTTIPTHEKNATEISEIVLAERWDLKKRREFCQMVHKK